MDNQQKRIPGNTRSAISDVLVEATRRLSRQGIESARLEAEVLLAFVIDRPRKAFYTDSDQPLTPRQESRYWELLERRRQGEPVAYICGEKEFYSLAFRVDRSVLIPRPETEGLVDAALEALRPEAEDPRTPTLFDVGTGSGAIAVAVLVNLTESRAFASDISGAALEIARQNAERHGVADRLTLLEGDLFAGFVGEVDVVVSNPPYVSEDERELLPPEVRDYEPPEALFAAGDGLPVIRRLIEHAPDHLPAGGRLVLEIGYDQHRAVHDLLAANRQWTDPDIRNDLAGIPRVAIAQKRQ